MNECASIVEMATITPMTVITMAVFVTMSVAMPIPMAVMPILAIVTIAIAIHVVLRRVATTILMVFRDVPQIVCQTRPIRASPLMPNRSHPFTAKLLFAKILVEVPNLRPCISARLTFCIDWHSHHQATRKVVMLRSQLTTIIARKTINIIEVIKENWMIATLISTTDHSQRRQYDTTDKIPARKNKTHNQTFLRN